MYFSLRSLPSPEQLVHLCPLKKDSFRIPMYLDKVAIPSFILNREVLTGVLSAGSLFLVTPVPESFLVPH